MVANSQVKADELIGAEKYVVGSVTYTVHSASAVFPALETEEFDKLVEDIKANGLIMPIRVRGREILDGRTRLRACLSAGVTPTFLEAPSGVNVFEFVASMNLRRRNLDSGQRAMVAQALVRLARQSRAEQAASRETRRDASRQAPRSGAAPAPDAGQETDAALVEDALPDSLKDAAKQVDSKALPSSSDLTSKKAADAMGVPVSTVQRAGTTAKHAPDLQEPVTSGLISLHDANQICNEPLTVRKQAVQLVRDKAHKTAQGAIRAIKQAPDLEEPVSSGLITLKDANEVCNEPLELRKQAVQLVRDKKHRTASIALRSIKPAGEKPTGSKPSAKGRKATSGAPKSESAADLPPLPSLGGKGGGNPLGPPRLVKTPGAPGDDAPAGQGASQVPAQGPFSPSGSESDPPPPAKGLPAEVENPPNAELAHWPVELLSPEPVVTACREIMGTIDLDPCSSEQAQERVGAKLWLRSDQRPLTEAWKGNVFLFPPAKLFKDFAAKLLHELDGPRVPSAAFVSNFDLSQRWPGHFLDHRLFRALVISKKPVEFDVGGRSRKWRASSPLAVFLFGTEATASQLAQAFGFWGRVLVAARGE